MGSIKILAYVSGIAVTLMSFQNCSMYSESQIDGMLSSNSSGTPTSAQLEASAMKIIQRKCVSCHNVNNPSGQIDDLLTKDSLLYYRLIIPGEPNLSDLYTVIKNGDMPPAPNKPLTSTESQIIYDWILTGFSDTSSGITPPNQGPITELAPTFSSIKALIINNKCLSCHNSTNSSGGVNFSTYASTMNTVQAGRPEVSPLYTSTVSQRMPTTANKLTGAELQAIQQWITNGAPNN